jgi:acetylornithine deacetylase/succinyl-diaminopimelate desuccinylase-like protein
MKSPQEWLADLVQIPSVNPEFADLANGAGRAEWDIVQYLAAQLSSLGVQVIIDEVLPSRPNLVAILRGHVAETILFDIHSDTVGKVGMIEPFRATIKGERMYGRGTVDTKATLAILLHLIEKSVLTAHPPRFTIILGAGVDEEQLKRGCKGLARWLNSAGIVPATIVVAEPTMCSPCHGHKGSLRLEFSIGGKSSHTAVPHLGINAITDAAKAILAIRSEHERLALAIPGVLGTPTLSVVRVHGGKGLNIVPDNCCFSIDRRLVAEESLQEVRNAITHLITKQCTYPIGVTTISESPPFYQPLSTPIITTLSQITGNIPIIVPFGTDMDAYHGFASGRVVIGPGSIEQAHTADEWISLSSLEALTTAFDKWLFD